jgi:hypothetical protein
MLPGQGYQKRYGAMAHEWHNGEMMIGERT